jgi:predicted RNA-binding Zn ribbon-like protein
VVSVGTGQWFVSPEGTRWFFDAGAHSLDLVHTCGLGLDEPEWERLGTRAELGRWLAARFGSTNRATTEDLTSAYELRAAVTRAALLIAAGRLPSAADVDTINAYAARPDIAPRLAGGLTPSPAATAAAAISTLARDAVAVLSRPERVRECGAGDCPLVFYDDSRSGTRRWCSMSRCGNRAKVRSHRHRNRPDENR